LWRLEIAKRFRPPSDGSASMLSTATRRLPRLRLMPIPVDADTSTYAWLATLRLSERFSLTLYDAAYLELAQRRSLSLATLDRGAALCRPVTPRFILRFR
jgi:predicted nucleic acid-binding protein